ncbi:uncharacterized protein TM35_000401850 [Trypanosoma theileri]|uniref:Uncharacterized protein n=1 Tax=Trypanosoma theileri TaxID=67003 RepID=A0A1X0NK73_9TRYP|nr:uncharacterized protein TM35_000401850 [Trypanosoma theileri]ORC84918.1 hypothetical protein TM35_000401850 [Trypanosoma theileri]
MGGRTSFFAKERRGARWRRRTPRHQYPQHPQETPPKEYRRERRRDPTSPPPTQRPGARTFEESGGASRCGDETLSETKSVWAWVGAVSPRDGDPAPSRLAACVVHAAFSPTGPTPKNHPNGTGTVVIDGAHVRMSSAFGVF